MPKIKVLDGNTACRIAAGEVVERPVSVVKELVENALDAGADSVMVTVNGGGTELITVVDNGCGISQEDTPLAFHRHATSKISDAADLDSIQTLGFRGEALPGIAAVSELVIKTRVSESDAGYTMRIRGGSVIHSDPVGCPVGTSITVSDLYFNTPARRKHLKSKSTEGGLIADLMQKMALVRPDVRFMLKQRDRELFRSPGTGKLPDTLAAVYGVKAAGLMIPAHADDGGITMAGFVGKPELNRSTRQQITISVNGRLVRSTAINQALDEAYKGLMTVGRYPVAVLHLQLPPDSLDVNIHPAKTEIKMENEARVINMLRAAVRGALQSANLIPVAGFPARTGAGLPAASEPYKLAFSTSPSKQHTIGTGNPSPAPIRLEEPSGQEPANMVHREPVQPAIMNGKTGEAIEPDNTGEAGIPGLDKATGADFEYHPGGKREQGTEGEMAEPAAAEEQGDYNTELTRPKSPASIGGGYQRTAGSSMDSTNIQWRVNPPLNEVSFNSAVFPCLQVVGQLLNMYIVCQGEDGVYLIDQHAAHERVLFEKYHRQVLESKPQVQYLLSPLNLHLKAHEKEVLRGHREELEALGFVLDDFGRDSMLIRGIPVENNLSESERLIVDLVETIMEEGKPGGSGVKFALSALLACKAAIKAGEKMTMPSMQSLVEQLSRAVEPFTCPHGRPTLVTINRRELSAMFKRV